MFSIFSKKPTVGAAGVDFSPQPTSAKEVSFLLPFYRSQPIYWEFEELERAGKVECLGIHGWGTWVGRFLG